MNTVSIQDVGPVLQFEMALPDGGGLVVIEGDNGIGKTTVLHTAEVLCNGGSIPEGKRDGAPAGEVNGFGRRLKVTSRTTHSGDLEIEGMGGRLIYSERASFET